jgi:hypothetical protein
LTLRPLKLTCAARADLIFASLGYNHCDL